MRFYSFDKAPVLAMDVVAGPSRAWLAAGFLLVLIFPVAGIAMLGGGAGWMGWWFIGLPLLYLYFAGRRLLWACDGKAWLLRWNSQRMTIRLGDVFERDLARLSVVVVELREIQWVQSFSTTTISKFAGETGTRSRTSLEIKLRSDDLTELGRRLAEARRPKVWRGWSSSREVPVSVGSDGVMRVQWHGGNAWVSPGLGKMLAMLKAAGVAVQEAVSETNDFTVSTADKEKMERQIVDLVQSGDLFEAVKLTRQRYGYSLTEAKRFVDGLRGVPAEGK